MSEAQRIAGIGMDRARELLHPGVSAHAVATEALYAMLHAGVEGTSVGSSDLNPEAGRARIGAW